MNSQKIMDKFSARLKKLNAYEHALAIINYDASTVMPTAGSIGRSEAVGVLSEEQYRLATDEAMDDMILQILESPQEFPTEITIEAKERNRDKDKLKKIPLKEYIEFVTLQSKSARLWEKAKEEDDYDQFAPILKQIISFKIAFSQYFDQTKSAYDVMLDDYHRGLNTVTLDSFFTLIKRRLIPLVDEIKNRSNSNTATPLSNKTYPVEQQKKLSQKLMQILNLESSRCSLGESEHPFTTSVSNKDVRITTHYHSDSLLPSMYSVIHEGGHALFDSNTSDLYNGLETRSTSSMALHESQSRLFENMIGRDYRFLSALWPILLELFPAQLAELDSYKFYQIANQCVPGPIRIEADELTYPLHILIRYELEKMIFKQEISIDELPYLWNQKYKEYLGIKIKTNREGILQDMHWSDGSFGYFPTYALGSAWSAQFVNAMEKQVDFNNALKNLNLTVICDWLRKNIWQYGGQQDAEQILRNATGSDFNPEHYINYLVKKFKNIYKI